MISDARAQHRGYASRFQREKPDCAAAVGSDYIGAQICFRKVRDSGSAVDLERDESDPRRAIERIQLQSGWNEAANQIGRKGPMKEGEPSPDLMHREVLQEGLP